jgi:uncharacterized protein YbaP (TraB family)
MKKFLLFVAALLIADTLAAQSAVWKVTNGANTLYLGGSVHALRQSDLPPPKEYDAAYKAADIMVFEADMMSMFDPDAAMRIMQLSLIGANKTIKSMLSESTYKRLEAKCAQMGMPAPYMMGFKPFMLISMMEVSELGKIGFDASGGLDMYYIMRAGSEGKKMDFLESPEYQMTTAIDIDPKNVDDFISKSLDDLDAHKSQKMTPKMVDELKSGTWETIEKEMDDLKRRYPYIYKPLFLDRNAKWLIKIDQYLNTKESEFIIVGYAHLVGQDGLLESLKRKGYKVEQPG